MKINENQWKSSKINEKMHKIKSKIYKKNLKSADLVINPRKDLKGGGIGGRTSNFQNHMILEF